MKSSISKKIDTAWLVITSNCNLNCPYCYMDADNGQRGYSIEQFQSILRFLKDAATKTVIFSGGEPCTHPLLPSFIEQASEQGISVGIATNGSIIHQSLIDCFVKNNVFLQISVDTIRDSIFSKVRGKDIVSTISNNIQVLLNQHVPIALSCTLSDINCDYVIEVCEFAKKNNIQTIHFGPLIPTARCNRYNLSFSRYYETCIQLYQYQMSNYLDIRIDIIEELVGLISNMNYNLCDTPIYYCNAMAGKNVEIDIEGNVRQCGLIEPQHSFNIFESTNIEPVSSQVYSGVFNVINEVPVGDIPLCTRCEYSFVCRGGCRACAFQISGNAYGEIPYCGDIKRLIDVIQNDFRRGKLDNYICFLNLMRKIDGVSGNPVVKKTGIY